MVLKLLAELVDFWWDDLTVRVFPSLDVPIVLVIVLCHPKLFELSDLRDDGIRV